MLGISAFVSGGANDAGSVQASVNDSVGAVMHSNLAPRMDITAHVTERALPSNTGSYDLSAALLES